MATRHSKTAPGGTLLRSIALFLPAIMSLLMLQLYFAGNWYAIAHSYSISMVFGIVSYTLFCCSLLMATRLRFLDRLFGHDRVLRYHGYIAAVAIATGGVHYGMKSVFIEEATVQSSIGLTAFVIIQVVVTATALLMTSGFSFLTPVLSALRSFTSRRMKLDYSQVKFLHNGVSVAVVLLIIHVYLASSTKESLLRMSFMGVFGSVAIGRFLYHKLLRQYFNRKKGFLLTKNEQLTDGIVRLTFATSGQKRLAFSTGQFCYCKIDAHETGSEEHPFTLSSPPESSGVQLTVKELGNYTAKLKKLGEGAPVMLDGPYGIFIPSINGRKNVFVAGGIGITPFLSVLSSWQEKSDAPETVLVWSVQREEQLIDLSHLEKLRDTSSWFTFIPTVTQSPTEKFRRGRISRELLSEVITDADLSRTEVFVCGPAALLQFTNRYCRARGMSRRNIHFERFSF